MGMKSYSCACELVLKITRFARFVVYIIVGSFIDTYASSVFHACYSSVGAVGT